MLADPALAPLPPACMLRAGHVCVGHVTCVLITAKTAGTGCELRYLPTRMPSTDVGYGPKVLDEDGRRAIAERSSPRVQHPPVPSYAFARRCPVLTWAVCCYQAVSDVAMTPVVTCSPFQRSRKSHVPSLACCDQSEGVRAQGSGLRAQHSGLGAIGVGTSGSGVGGVSGQESGGSRVRGEGAEVEVRGEQGGLGFTVRDVSVDLLRADASRLTHKHRPIGLINTVDR
eukprot:753612-Rhodomonas_salina.3